MTTSYTDFASYLTLVKKYRSRARALTVGDSWFQYPLRDYGDLQRKIAVRYRTRLLCLDDSYPGRDAREGLGLVPRWARLARHLDEMNRPFDLILVSQGGNDVIGEDFAHHLKRASDAPVGTRFPWNSRRPAVVREHIKLDPLRETFERVEASYLDLVELRRAHARRATIITHTYANVTPCDEAYEIPGIKQGPWMWKPMRRVGLKDADAQRELAQWLLESFANLLDGIRPRAGFKVLDTRLELESYDEYWDNEIHPNDRGFQKLVDEHWADAIDTVL